MCQVVSQVVNAVDAMFLVIKWQVPAKRAPCGKERRQESKTKQDKTNKPIQLMKNKGRCQVSFS